MDGQVSTLERILLDGNAEPAALPLSLLQDITNCFSDEQRIGNGGFAVVYKGMVGDGMVAVKKLSKTYDIQEKTFHKEVECLAKARHKNIVRFLGYCAKTQGEISHYEGKFVMADTRNWLLCFEYVPNGSLDKYITDLHNKRILHLDLKPDNILIDDRMVPKIADFGLSRCLDEEQTRLFTTHVCGSFGYLAPEIFRGQFAFASDIYSLGVIIVEILTGEKGYPEDENVVESWMNRLEGDSTQLEQVIVCTKIGIECMELDPRKRPAAHHIVDRLNKTTHIIETGIGSSSIEQKVNLLKEQHCEESTENSFATEIEDLAKCQEKEDQWSLWGSQDTEQDWKDTNVSSSNLSVFRKMSDSDIFNRKISRNFMRNGGRTIQQSISVKIFQKEELNAMLNIENLVGSGAYGLVYEGILGNKLVAIRKPIASSLLRNEQFGNEVIRRSQVIHKNILTFIGCCLEVDVPLLVYEFVSNGSLHDILHGNKVSLNLGVRLSIVAQAADGLAYMHAKTNSRILLCGLEASNILLDGNFVPKISDFGISRLRDKQPDAYFDSQSAPANEGFVDESTLPGDYFVGKAASPNKGYFMGPCIAESIDEPTNPYDYFIGSRPEPPKKVYSISEDLPGDYFMDRRVVRNGDPISMEENHLTQENDVYSFGIIILELISRKKATYDDNNSLVNILLKSDEEGRRATELFDTEIAVTRDLEILDGLAKIAVECLSPDVRARPTMAEVARRLTKLSHTYMARN